MKVFLQVLGLFCIMCMMGTVSAGEVNRSPAIEKTIILVCKSQSSDASGFKFGHSCMQADGTTIDRVMMPQTADVEIVIEEPRQ